MDIFSALRISVLITALIISNLLAFVVYKNNPKSATNIIFSLLCIVTSAWLVCTYISLTPEFLTYSLFWGRMTIFFAVPQVVLFYLLANTLPNKKIPVNKKWLSIISILGIAVMLITISPFAFIGIKVDNNSLSPIPGPGIIPFIIFAVFFSLGAIVILLKRLKSTVGIKKEQLRFVMIGILLMLGLIITTILLPAVLLQDLTFVPFAPLYALAFLVLTTYTIIKHRLMNIRLLVARTVAYTILIIILGLFYTADMFLISNYFFKKQVTMNQTISFALLALFIAFTFQPLKNLIEEATDSIFFKGKYISNELVLNLTQIMASSLHLESMTQRILQKLLYTMRISRGAFVIFKYVVVKDCKNFDVIHEGYTEMPDYDQAEINKLFSLRRIIILDEEEDGETKQLMRDLDVAVAIPLYDDDHNLGLMLLGNKKSGEVYSEQDIQVLEIFGPEMSVAIQNAKSFEEISKFNSTLRNEVEKATKDLQAANARLKELDRLKDEFVSVASHELRTPLTAIKSYLWMAIQGRGGELNEKQKYYIDRAYNSSDRLIKMVNDMLNISRIESGRLTLDVRAVELDEVALEVVGEVLPRAEELGVEVVIEPHSKLPQVLADPDKIKEVFFNLIGNSLKFTPKDGKISIAFSQKDDMIETQVTDTGSGIDADDLPKLFQKFNLLPGSYTTNQSVMGTGLGLFISRSIVELHDGKIWAKSDGRNKGSQFYFTLKVFNEEDQKKLTEKYGHKTSQEVGLVHTQI